MMRVREGAPVEEIRHQAGGKFPGTGKPFMTRWEPPKTVSDEVIEEIPEVPEPLYKILVDGMAGEWEIKDSEGRSNLHVSPMRPWPLPTEDEPGAWMRTSSGRARLSGVHHPLEFYSPGSTVYLVEIEEGAVQEKTKDGIIASALRLVREVTWADLNLITEGDHVVESGYWRAVGTAHVRISGGTLVATEEVTFEASGIARVYCRDFAVGTATDLAKVSGHGNVSVNHRGKSRGFYWNNSSEEITGTENAVLGGWDSWVTLAGKAEAHISRSYAEGDDESKFHFVGGPSEVYCSQSVATRYGPFAEDSKIERDQPEIEEG